MDHKGCVTLTKQRYNDMVNALHAKFENNVLVDEITEVIKQSLHFDPNIKMYDKEKGKKFMEWRKKRAQELGLKVSQYNPK